MGYEDLEMSRRSGFWCYTTCADRVRYELARFARRDGLRGTGYERRVTGDGRGSGDGGAGALCELCVMSHEDLEMRCCMAG